MQAVILAAGRGTRMGSLTDTTPKPMLSVAGKNLLVHKLDMLPSQIDEVIFVIGYLGEQIMEYFGDTYNGKHIKYVEQKELLGTANALWLAKDLLGERFIVMMGDDVYSKEDIAACLEHEWSILVKKIDLLEKGGKVVFDDNGKLKDIIEGQSHNEENACVYTGLCVLGKEIFDYTQVKLDGKEEWGLPQTFLQAVNDHDIAVVESEFWLQLTDRGDIKRAEEEISSL